MQEATLSADGQPLSLGQLAARCRVPVHRMRYCLDAYEIAPRARVGGLRCWFESDLPAIKAALARVASNRRGVL